MSLYLKLVFCRLFIMVAAFMVPVSGFSASVQFKLMKKTEEQARQRLRDLLGQYCSTQCELISVEVEVVEKTPDHLELGFEGVNNLKMPTPYEVAGVQASVQIDDRISQKDRTRLQNILNQGISKYATGKTLVTMVPVELPNIGEFEKIAGVLRHRLEQKVAKVVEKVFGNYCPNRCILGHATVEGSLITSDDAESIKESELFRHSSTSSILHIDRVRVNLTMDEQMPPDERVATVRLVRAKLNFVEPLDLEVDTIPFPESFDERQRKKKLESEDPYGLEKLRRMLVLFRELAGTKEIIERSETKDSLTSKESSESSSKSESSENTAESNDMNLSDWAAYIAGFVLLIFIAVFLLLRFGQENKNARMMIESAASEGAAEGAGESSSGDEKNSSDDVLLAIEKEKITEELTTTFINSPKVARETFMRMLQENGIEDTAKYLHILGKMVVYELIDDPALQRQLYDLGDFYHKSDYHFTLKEEVELLRKLKVVVTANEIRVMAKNSLDQFEFLSKLSPAQLFQLVEDESPQVQSLVLTQLDPELRQDVFELYSGDKKERLTQELCRAEAIPKEFLHNVAAALNRKVASKPEFDAETVRTSDILLELLERAKPSEQRSLMGSLLRSNPDAARAVKSKLVTLDVLGYIKTGHLLEIMLGIEQEELLIFLGGAPQKIADFVMRHAPEELVHSWQEELDNTGVVNEASYRIIETKILGKVRKLAHTGVIDLLEVNGTIFGDLEQERRSDDSGIKPENLIA